MIIFSLDYGSLLPADCMSSNFCYILDIVDKVIKSLDLFLFYCIQNVVDDML